MQKNASKCKIELIVHPPRDTDAHQRGKSALYRRTANKSLRKELPVQLAKNQAQQPSKIQDTIVSFEMNLANRSSESRQFAQKCVQLLSRKNGQTQFKTKQPRVFHKMMSRVVLEFKHDAKRQNDREKHNNSQLRNYETNDNYLPDNREETKLSTGCDVTLSKPKRILPDQNQQSDNLQLFSLIKSMDFLNPNQHNNHNSQVNRRRIFCHARHFSRGSQSLTRQYPQFIKMNAITCFNSPQDQLTSQRAIMNVKTKQQLFRTRASSCCTSHARRVSISNPQPQHRFMRFSTADDFDVQYMRKLKSFLDFLYKINFSNGIYTSLQLQANEDRVQKYKAYVGKGNNSSLIKSLLQRRFWIQIVQNVDLSNLPDDSEINFYWTQHKIENVFSRQTVFEKQPIYQKQQQIVFKTLTTHEHQKRSSASATKRLIDQQLNCRILSKEQAVAVEGMIFNNGYVVPEQNSDYEANIITNHLPGNHAIGSKKNLFRSMFAYYTAQNKDPFEYIPQTYLVQSVDDKQFTKFYNKNCSQTNRVWIVKPGQNSNRGKGIRLTRFSSIINLIRSNKKHQNGQKMTSIIQSYINKPMLYNGRKFDLRHYILLTSVNGLLKAYWHKEGYVRTSSEEYDLDDLQNPYIHLTNDAIQRSCEQYQLYEPANKLSYNELQRYLDNVYAGKGYNLERDILGKMKAVMQDVLRANCRALDRQRKLTNFEIFGLDIIIDKDFKPWLIEANYNPCLEVNCPLLGRVIPTMLENSLRIGLDPLMPPKCHFPAAKRCQLSQHHLQNVKYELIFDQGDTKESIRTFPCITTQQDDDDTEQEHYEDQQ